MAHDADLSTAIASFLKLYAMSPVTFGRKALNDPHFVRDITAEKPRRVWPETEAKVRAFMEGYTPETARAA